MAGGRRRSARKTDRKKGAEKAIMHLSSVIESNTAQSKKLRDSAARQILSIGKKHGVRPKKGVKVMICRTCKKSMIPGTSSRVRISSKKIICTCLRCDRVTRQGPDFGGLRNER